MAVFLKLSRFKVSKKREKSALADISYELVIFIPFRAHSTLLTSVDETDAFRPEAFLSVFYLVYCGRKLLIKLRQLIIIYIVNISNVP